MNTPIDYSSRYSFGHFCCRVKQGKRLSEFLEKYTDSGTETTLLAGYNILVFKYVKISASGSTTCKTHSQKWQFVRRENHHKVEILNYSVSLQYRKRNRDFITINFQNLAFFRESFTCSNVILALSLEIYFP